MLKGVYQPCTAGCGCHPNTLEFEIGVCGVQVQVQPWLHETLSLKKMKQTKTKNNIKNSNGLQTVGKGFSALSRAKMCIRESSSRHESQGCGQDTSMTASATCIQSDLLKQSHLPSDSNLYPRQEDGYELEASLSFELCNEFQASPGYTVSLSEKQTQTKHRTQNPSLRLPSTNSHVTRDSQKLAVLLQEPWLELWTRFAPVF